MAHNAGWRVQPHIGPSSILLALMASGMNGQQFAFKGYLPRDQQRRERIWKEMKEGLSRRKETQIFMEPPYRNDQAFKECLNNLTGDQQLCMVMTLRSKPSGSARSPFPGLEATKRTRSGQTSMPISHWTLSGTSTASNSH